MAGVAPPSGGRGEAGHEVVRGATKSETGADLQEMSEEDSLGVLVRAGGTLKSFLTLLCQAWEDLVGGGDPPHSSGNHCGG